MYSVDARDTVVELKDTPQSSVGAPCPIVLATEHELYLAYYLQNTPPGWDGTTVTVVDESSGGEPVAVVKFKHLYSHMFGPPNDEAFSGHPLASRGLEPYSVYEIQHSSWIRILERMNSVHPYHRPDSFSRYHHFIFSFHDTTFECVAEGFSITFITGSPMSAIKHLA
ncbi:MAG: hypothetical protein J0M04_17585 [Verrucomicrobia bacterium]|nr:hypothetical protein [Verrucomicrobiota bacterium]